MSDIDTAPENPWPVVEPSVPEHKANVAHLHTRSDESQAPEYVDVAAILNGTFNPPRTSIGSLRTDGVALLYAGATNGLVGAPESGKTLIATAMVADEIFKGGSALWLDLDHNGPAATVTRLRSFGIPTTVLSNSERFRLACPDDAEQVTAIVADDWAPSIAIIDSIGELLPMFGGSSNDADDYTRINREVMSRIAGRGTAVLTIDHEAKSNDSRAYGATGTVAKKRAIDGAYLRVNPVRTFIPDRGGEAALAIVKDRHGHLRSVSPMGQREPITATFELLPGNATNWRFTLPETANAPGALFTDLELLEQLDPPPKSQRDVQERMNWGGSRALTALRMLRERSGSDGSVSAPGAPRLYKRRSAGAHSGSNSTPTPGEQSGNSREQGTRHPKETP